MTNKRAAKTTKSAGRRVPVLRVHKQSQRCYGTFSGQEIWFGARRDPETQKRFDAYLAEWLARGRKLEQVREESLTVRSLAARYLIHLEAEHDAAWHRNNAARMKYALDALLKLHGPTPAKDYGPLKLKALREHIASAKRRDGSPRLSVGTINERIQIVRNAFQWAVSEELVPAAIIEGLRAVQRLRKNKPGMRAGRKVEPVDRATVDATLPLLSQPVAGLVELMWWTGARPSELFFLRPCDIDRSGSVWTAGLVEHKTANKGMRRTLLFGAQSQAVLQSFLLRPESSPLFSPRDAVDEMQRKKRGNRKTPLYPSHAARYRRQRVERPDRIVGEVYTADAFRKAVQRAVTAANRERKAKGLDPIQSWSPYQLRHAAATRIRKDHGIEAARVLLGHSSATMTEVYAEADMLAAAKVVEAAG